MNLVKNLQALVKFSGGSKKCSGTIPAKVVRLGLNFHE